MPVEMRAKGRPGSLVVEQTVEQEQGGRAAGVLVVQVGQFHIFTRGAGEGELCCVDSWIGHL